MTNNRYVNVVARSAMRRKTANTKTKSARTATRRGTSRKYAVLQVEAHTKEASQTPKEPKVEAKETTSRSLKVKAGTGIRKPMTGRKAKGSVPWKSKQQRVLKKQLLKRMLCSWG